MRAAPKLAGPLAAGLAARVKISEIFHSLQGESLTVGAPTSFVRLVGCPLRCRYCDTEYAFTGGEWMGFDAILEKVAAFGAKHVTVTGGEPLAQKACPALLTSLCDANHAVALETGGAHDVSGVDPRVTLVMDFKTPGSGEAARNRYENIEFLRQSDQVKFVICNRADYEWSRALAARFNLPARCTALFSPSWGEQEPAELAQWILDDRLAVRFQLQLHKVLWGGVRGR